MRTGSQQPLSGICPLGAEQQGCHERWQMEMGEQWGKKPHPDSCGVTNTGQRTGQAQEVGASD